MKATKHYFPVILFIKLLNRVQYRAIGRSLSSVLFVSSGENEINETYGEELSYGVVCV